MPTQGMSTAEQGFQGTAAPRGTDLSMDRAAPGAPIADLIYDLRDRCGSSDTFYSELAVFCDLLVAEIDGRAGAAIRDFGKYVQAEWHEPPRSHGEYAIDLLTLGFVLRRYGEVAQASQAWAIKAARWLYWLRSRKAWSKSVADFARAMLIRQSLLPRMDHRPSETLWPPERLRRVIAWLQATGEFEQEVARIERWASFLTTLPGTEAAHLIETATDLFDWFEHEAEWTLGEYTKGVREFLAGEYGNRGCREDQVFCGKAPVEYHLGMAATEVMNRGLRAEFDRTRRRAVLVPACLRDTKAKDCKARVSGVDMTCSGCDPACTVNRITQRMRGVGALVYLVPHSTGFSKWLERWQRAKGVGVVAVACLLNILPGGYEMRARSIAAQCVPLDYPGCRKHWRRESVATGVNEDRLVHITITPNFGRQPEAGTV
jgi:hypothetical protein